MFLFMWKEMCYDLKPCSNQIFHLLVFTYKVFFHIDDNHIKFNQTFHSVYSCHCKFQVICRKCFYDCMTLKEYECPNCRKKFPEDLNPDKSAKMYVKYMYKIWNLQWHEYTEWNVWLNLMWLSSMWKKTL
jgi:hypothetical protein